ncbi:response regulator transcription factor [Baekduia soli]|uniref:Response regulator transcription factor n=1 Tax=Baekduia soli TaxID=496014 RepID=A0A5B8U978_9ACTN|nr:response regulator transcription factor [Baekduia soli]QEC49713.1 response regulator transcription factor [Baekduia soli]
MGPMEVLLVDDHEIVRAGLRATLEAWGGFTVVGEASSGGLALRRVRELAPDVAIVDFRMGDMRGDDLCRKLLAALPGLRVLVLSGYLSEEAVRAAHRAGAWRYVTKSAGLDELRRALEDLRSGAASHTVEQAASVVARQHALSPVASPVTTQQSQVLELAAAGLTDREIGQELFLAESTVRFHIQKLKTTLKVRNKTELVAKAIRNGLVSPTEEL